MSLVTAGLPIPSVRAIRDALEDIPGAIREDPLPEDAHGGTDPAAEVWVSDPGYRSESLALDSPDPTADDDAISDGPNVIFEIPPEVTDTDIQRVLGHDDFAEMKRLHEIRGIDALGWYVTFHQRTAQHGVHIPLEGALLLAGQAFPQLPVPDTRKYDLAFHAILRHEVFHFAADCMAANWELAIGADAYWKAKEKHRNAQGYVELEEAMANAYMLRGFQHPRRLLANSGGASPALREYTKGQPAGYRDAHLYAKSRYAYVAGCRGLSTQVQHAAGQRWPVPSSMDTLLLYADPFRIDWNRCPIIISDRFNLRESLGINVEFFTSIPHVIETQKFRKSLDKLGPSIQKKWQDQKRKLAMSTSLDSLGFQQWKKGGPDCYSVHVGSNRAHLRLDRQQSTWSALDIGSHLAMGHGP
jgi:mRNA-degrading endonuclease RelE of RelBE toxin-antitoxin system